jgi:hypothetical protein
MVLDTTPPEIATLNKIYLTCIPNEAVVTIIPPEVNDVCTDNETITLLGYVSKINGHQVEATLIENNQTILPIGIHEIT